MNTVTINQGVTKAFIYDISGNVTALMEISDAQLEQFKKTHFVEEGKRYLGTGYGIDGWEKIATIFPQKNGVITIITNSHDGGGIPAMKEVPVKFAPVVRAYINAIASMDASHSDSDKAAVQIWKATGKFLMLEAGWSKYDARTIWFETKE